MIPCSEQFAQWSPKISMKMLTNSSDTHSRNISCHRTYYSMVKIACFDDFSEIFLTGSKKVNHCSKMIRKEEKEKRKNSNTQILISMHVAMLQMPFLVD